MAAIIVYHHMFCACCINYTYLQGVTRVLKLLERITAEKQELGHISIRTSPYKH